MNIFSKKGGYLTISLWALGLILFFAGLIRKDYAENYRVWTAIMVLGIISMAIGAIRLFIGGTRK